MNDLDRLPDLISVPPTDVGDDVARGETALRRRRGLLAGLGCATAVAVIVGSVAWSGGGGSAPRSHEPPYAGATVTSAPPSHHVSKTRKQPRNPMAAYRREVEADKKTVGEWRDVLAEHLSAHGTLQAYDGVGFSGSTSDFGTKLDWNGGGLLQFMIGPHWNAIQGVPGAPVPPLEPRTYQGLEARVGESDGVLVVSLLHDDGTVVTLLAAT